MSHCFQHLTQSSVSHFNPVVDRHAFIFRVCVCVCVVCEEKSEAGETFLSPTGLKCEVLYGNNFTEKNYLNISLFLSTRNSSNYLFTVCLVQKN